MQPSSVCRHPQMVLETNGNAKRIPHTAPTLHPPSGPNSIIRQSLLYNVVPDWGVGTVKMLSCVIRLKQVNSDKEFEGVF